MTNKKRKDTFGNGLIAFLFICMIFLMGYAFKNPILLYSTNPEVEINHEYDPKDNIQQVFFIKNYKITFIDTFFRVMKKWNIIVK